MRTGKTFLTFVIVGLLLLAGIDALAKASPMLTFSTKSTYRKIDKTGKIVGPEVWKQALPAIGVGNIIFSTTQMPIGKENEYRNVGINFNTRDIREFVTRAYLPGTLQSIAAYVESTHSGYKIMENVAVLSIKRPDGRSAGDESRYAWKTEELSWDQSRKDLYPEEDFDRKLFSEIFAESSPVGEYTVKISLYLRFTTGKFEKRSKWEGNRWVTRDYPFMTDVLIAYGEAKITKSSGSAPTPGEPKKDEATPAQEQDATSVFQPYSR